MRIYISGLLIAISAGSLQAQVEFISPCLWEELMQADTTDDPIVQTRWILPDGSILILDKSIEISQNRHHEVCIRWMPSLSQAEKEP